MKKKENYLAGAFKRRKARITLLRNRGWTLERIGDEVGLTRERVRQILSQNQL